MIPSHHNLALTTAQSSASSSTSAEPPKIAEINLKKIYHIFPTDSQNSRTGSVTRYIFIIPISLFLHHSRVEQYKKNLTPDQIEDLTLSDSEVLDKYFKIAQESIDDASCSYIVAHLVNPERNKKGEITLQSFPLPQFKNEFARRSPEQVFRCDQELINLSKPCEDLSLDHTMRISYKKSQNSSKSKRTPRGKKQSTARHEVTKQDWNKAHMEVSSHALSLGRDDEIYFQSVFCSFFNAIAQLIKQNDKIINPYETLPTLFVTIANHYIESYPHIDSEIKKILNRKIFKFYEDMFYVLRTVVVSIDLNYVRCSVFQHCLKSIIEEIDNLNTDIDSIINSKINGENKCKNLISKLQKLNNSWKELFLGGIKSKSQSFLSAYKMEIETQLCNTISENHYFKINTDMTPGILIDFAISRTRFLRQRILDDIENVTFDSPGDSLKFCLLSTEWILHSLERKKWVEAIVHIKGMTTFLKKSVIDQIQLAEETKIDGSKDLENFEVTIKLSTKDSFKDLKRKVLEKYNTKDGSAEYKDFLTRYTLYGRFLNFIKFNFDVFMDSSFAKNPIEEQIKSIKSEFTKLNNSQILPAKDDKFKNWINVIKNLPSCEFGEHQRQFLRHLHDCITFKEFLQSNKDLLSLINADEIDEIHLVDLPKYPFIYSEIEPKIECWLENLKGLNESIQLLESDYFQSLSSPLMKDFPIALLREKFALLNERIRSVVEPVANFLSVFEKLQTLDLFLDPTGSSSSSTSSSKQINLYFEGSTKTVISLFQTDKRIFDDLQKYLSDANSGLSEETYVELSCDQEPTHLIPSSTSSSSSSSSSYSISDPIAPNSTEEDQVLLEEIVGEIEKAFGTTKREKTMKKLNVVFNHFGIKDEISIVGGKGSHHHLVIGKTRITIPRAKSLKLGLKSAIKQDTITQVLKLIQKRNRKLQSS